MSAGAMRVPANEAADAPGREITAAASLFPAHIVGVG
jgi:hypothetical protein